MQLIDKSDMQIGTVDSLRKCLKWYKKLFFHLMDMCLLNAHHMYVLQTSKKITLRKFSLSLCKEILAKHGTVTKNFTHRMATPHAPDRLQAAAYISRHHISSCPRKWCHVCYKRGQTTKSVSVVCRVQNTIM